MGAEVGKLIDYDNNGKIDGGDIHRRRNALLAQARKGNPDIRTLGNKIRGALNILKNEVAAVKNKSQLDFRVSPEDINIDVNDTTPIIRARMMNAYGIKGAGRETKKILLNVIPSHGNESGNNIDYVEKQGQITVTFIEGVPTFISANDITNSYGGISSYRAKIVSHASGIGVGVGIADGYHQLEGKSLIALAGITFGRTFEHKSGNIDALVMHVPAIGGNDSLTINGVQYRRDFK